MIATAKKSLHAYEHGVILNIKIESNLLIVYDIRKHRYIKNKTRKNEQYSYKIKQCIRRQFGNI